MPTKNLKKYSFTLLELIIAIIVVGIVITALPALLNTAANTQKTNIQEKTFFNAYSLINLINIEEWDENNTVDDNYYKVLTADNGDSDLLCIRKGVEELNNSSGAICATSNEKTSTIGKDSDENSEDKFDDIDDFNGFSTVVNDANISVKVRYMNDNANYSAKNIYFSENDNLVTNTNLKFIEVNVTSQSTGKLIAILKYTASNIGMVTIKSVSE